MLDSSIRGATFFSLCATFATPAFASPVPPPPPAPTSTSVFGVGAGTSTPATPPVSPQFGQSVEQTGSNFVSMAAGGSHSLSLDGYGAVTAWGRSSEGQCTVPVGVYKAISAGGLFSLAIKSDDTLAGWGANGNGQSTVPAGTYTALSAGYAHGAAIKSDGTLALWGANANGQTTAQTGQFLAVAAGGYHTIGIKADGTLKGWGLNANGQTTVPSGTYTAIAAGMYHSVALDAAGTMSAWGAGSTATVSGYSYGQSKIPVDAGSFIAISAGKAHTLGLRADGTVVSYGLSSATVGMPAVGTDPNYGQAIIPANTVGYTYTGIAAGGSQSLLLRAGSVTVVHSGVINGRYTTIQPAIDGATSGDTINIPAGTFVLSSQLTIPISLSVSGASTATTVIKSGITKTGQSDPGGNARGLILVGTAPASGLTVNVSNLTIDGNGNNVWQAVRDFGAGTFSNVAFNDIKYEWGGAGVYYQGTAIAAIASGAVNVTNCTFTNIGRVSTLYYGAASSGTVSGSTFTGQGLGDRYNSAVEISSGAIVTVQNNDISNYRGTAVTGTPGDPSNAIYVSSAFGTGTQATISGNLITNNLNGIIADPTGVTATATCNWFGTTDANSIAALVPGVTTFSPFRASSTDTACTGVGAVVLVGKGRSYSTIQAAFDASATVDNDSITIANGNYNEALTIKDSGLSISVGATAYSGASGTAPLSFTLNTGVLNATLAGAGAANVTANVSANSITTNSGANAIDGLAGIDTAVFASAMPSLVNSGSNINVGTDSVTNVELLTFSDGTVAVVGQSGSEYTTLNVALAASSSTMLLPCLQ